MVVMVAKHDATDDIPRLLGGICFFFVVFLLCKQNANVVVCIYKTAFNARNFWICRQGLGNTAKVLVEVGLVSADAFDNVLFENIACASAYLVLAYGGIIKRQVAVAHVQNSVGVVLEVGRCNVGDGEF